MLKKEKKKKKKRNRNLDIPFKVTKLNFRKKETNLTIIKA